MDKISITVERGNDNMKQSFGHSDVSLSEMLEAFTVVLTYLGYAPETINDVIKIENT